MLTIYGRPNSINVQKVRWCAAELGLDYRHVPLGGAFGGTTEPDYLAVNPNALVPAIEEDDGFRLWESNAIVRYLAARHGSGGLMPTDPRQRALAEQWMDWQATAIQVAITPVFWGLIRTPEAERDLAAIADGEAKLRDLFALLDGALAGQAFILGEDLTVGDIALGAASYRWLHLPIERPPLANVEAYHARLAERAAFRDNVMVPIT